MNLNQILNRKIALETSPYKIIKVLIMIFIIIFVMLGTYEIGYSDGFTDAILTLSRRTISGV